MPKTDYADKLRVAVFKARAARDAVLEVALTLPDQPDLWQLMADQCSVTKTLERCMAIVQEEAANDA